MFSPAEKKKKKKKKQAEKSVSMESTQTSNQRKTSRIQTIFPKPEQLGLFPFLLVPFRHRFETSSSIVG